jgi:hypothetical protein
VGHVRIAVIVLALCATAAAVVACSSRGPRAGVSSTTHGSSSGGATGPESTGSVGVQLTVVGGEQIGKVSYTLGNGTTSLGGSYNISRTSNLSFVIGSVPAGVGYGLTLTATTVDGTATCSFPAPGDPPTYDIVVLNRTTTVVSINMQCLVNQGLDSGTISVQGVSSNCAVWNTIVANPVNVTLDAGANVNDGGVAGSTGFYGGLASVPAAIFAGQDLVMVGSATAPDPASVAFTWTANGGALSSANGTIYPDDGGGAGVTNQTVFTCPSTGSGTYTVTLFVSDGPLPDGGGCDPKFTTGTVTVSCVSAVFDGDGGDASGGDPTGDDSGADAAGDDSG